MSAYVPGSIPLDAPAWIVRELQSIAQAWQQPQPFALLAVQHKPPPRLIDGILVEADGTDWDPGSGAGLYIRRAGAWVFLG